jgi:FixJ family two-component response regulator
LLDLSLPGVSGLELQRQLIEAGCMQPVVFVSGHGSVRTSVQAMRAGALDFIEKPWENDALIAAVRRALERDREARTRRDAKDSISRRVASLTPRESEVFRHVIAGRLNKQIAARLGTAEKTIKVHRARVMHKMAVRSVAELTRIAGLLGIGPEPES